ncbi:MAG: S8 family peptidase, partial [Bacteroidaceae bacterium]
VSASVYSRATGKLLASSPFISTTTSSSPISYTFESGGQNYSAAFYPALYQHSGTYGMEISLKYPSEDVNSDKIVLLRVASSLGKIRGWNMDESSTFSDFDLGLPYMNGSTQYLIASPADADSVIAVAAYASRLSIHDIYGDSYSFARYARERGDITAFSSNGPTMDGRVKPDIAAPGLLLYSAYSSFYETTNYAPKIQQTNFKGKTYDWVSMSGTSMSSPYVAGSIALWLQANPTLTPSQIKALFSRTAVQDKVMEYPNNIWGYGKIDVYKGLLDLLGLPTDSKKITLDEAVSVYTDDVAGSFHVRWVEAPVAFTLSVADMGGRIIYQKDVANQTDIETIVRLGFVPNGVYTVQIKTPAKTVVRKVKL